MLLIMGRATPGTASEPGAALVDLWQAVESLGTDTTTVGRVSSKPLLDWRTATDDSGKVPLAVKNGHPVTASGGSKEAPLVYRDIDFEDRKLFVVHGNVVFDNCLFDGSRHPEWKPGTMWVELQEHADGVTFRNCQFVGRSGSDKLNGGIVGRGSLDPTDYPANFGRAANLLVERCRFEHSSGDFLKPVFGPGTVFRHNHFGYPWLFDSDVIPWTEETGGVGILIGDSVVHKRAQSQALVDYPTTSPPEHRKDPDTAEWKNLGDIPNFDYMQGGGGGPVLWEGNFFEVGCRDHAQMQLINNIVRFAHDFETTGPVAGHSFVGNVFKLRENYDGPLYPYVIAHKVEDDGSLADVHVLGHMEFCYNLLIPQKKHARVMRLSGGAEENLVFVDNFLSGTRSLIPAPGKSIATTQTPVPAPPQAVAEARPPKILVAARLLSKVNADDTISYRTLPPLYRERASSLDVTAEINGTPLHGYDDSRVNTFRKTDRVVVTYTVSNAAGTATSVAVPK